VETTSARRLAELVGDLATDRPPRYAALAGRVRMLVADGRVPLGTRLPAERDLATALALSRATVTAAYARLREDGWAVARQGAGTFAALPAGPHRGAWVPGPLDDGAIDMAHAGPAAPAIVPAAFATALAELPRHLPQHGYHPGGLPELRARIADRYTARGLPTSPEQVLVTAGALHGVSTAFQTLLRRGQRLLLEQPTYPNALDAARSLGVRLLPTALDPDDADAWLSVAERTLAGARPTAAYLMPDFQNPTGRLLDVPGRERLARALRRAGTTAVVDESFAELWLESPPPPPLAAFGTGHLSVGSLSKSFWGGLRIGWVRGEADVVRQLTAVAVRATMSGPIDDVDRKTVPHEPMHPAFTTVRRTQEIQSLPASSVHQHERPAMAQILRNPVLDIHLGAQRGTRLRLDRLAAHPEESLRRQRQRSSAAGVQVRGSYRFDRSRHAIPLRVTWPSAARVSPGSA